MSNAYQTITVEKRGSVDWLTLNRPEALNSISVEMVTELNDYFGRLFHDRDTRIVVRRGAGRAYCAGLDIKERSAAEDEVRQRVTGVSHDRGRVMGDYDIGRMRSLFTHNTLLSPNKKH